MSGILHLIPDTSSQKGFNRTIEKWRGGKKNKKGEKYSEQKFPQQEKKKKKTEQLEKNLSIWCKNTQPTNNNNNKNSY